MGAKNSAVSVLLGVIVSFTVRDNSPEMEGVNTAVCVLVLVLIPVMLSVYEVLVRPDGLGLGVMLEEAVIREVGLVLILLGRPMLLDGAIMVDCVPVLVFVSVILGVSEFVGGGEGVIAVTE